MLPTLRTATLMICGAFTAPLRLRGTLPSLSGEHWNQLLCPVPLSSPSGLSLCCTMLHHDICKCYQSAAKPCARVRLIA